MANQKLERWQDKTDEWLLAVAGIFLFAYGIPILSPSLPPWLDRTCQLVVYMVWAVFVADLIVRVALADRRGRYLLSNWLDVLVVALPILRPLRAVRAILLARIIRAQGESASVVGGC